MRSDDSHFRVNPFVSRLALVSTEGNVLMQIWRANTQNWEDVKEILSEEGAPMCRHGWFGHTGGNLTCYPYPYLPNCEGGEKTYEYKFLAASKTFDEPEQMTPVEMQKNSALATALETLTDDYTSICEGAGMSVNDGAIPPLNTPIHLIRA